MQLLPRSEGAAFTTVILVITKPNRYEAQSSVPAIFWTVAQMELLNIVRRIPIPPTEAARLRRFSLQQLQVLALLKLSGRARGENEPTGNSAPSARLAARYRPAPEKP